jgi:hypothetical protein
MADACNIGQDVQRADGLSRLRAIRFAGHIERQEFPADAFGLRAPGRFIAIGDPDRRAHVGKGFRQRSADA